MVAFSTKCFAFPNSKTMCRIKRSFGSVKNGIDLLCYHAEYVELAFRAVPETKFDAFSFLNCVFVLDAFER